MPFLTSLSLNCDKQFRMQYICVHFIHGFSSFRRHLLALHSSKGEEVVIKDVNIVHRGVR